MLRTFINGLTLIVCLTGLMAVLAVSVVAQEFRVDGAGLEAVPTSYQGRCPGLIKFQAEIQASARGRVRYTYFYSDGATGPEGFIDFEGPGVKQVETTWTLGDTSLTRYEGWAKIRILSPNSYLSNRASFDIDCRSGEGKSHARQARDGQETLQNAVERIRSLAVSINQPSVTSAGQFVACPIKEARTEVTTSLPIPWWNTPQIGALERVSIQTVGGNKTLVCEYWAYHRTVSIMRRFPEGATNCSTEGRGFRCH